MCYRNWVPWLNGVNEQDEELIMTLDKGLLQQAFTHPTNKRLAWLGDSIISLAVTEHLYRTARHGAGVLDPIRQKIIGNENLKQTVAERFYLKSQVLVPPSERNPDSREILAAPFEALTCAVFLEKGYEIVAAFVCRTLLPTRLGPQLCPSNQTKSYLVSD